MEASLIFPHQLYSDHPSVREDVPVYLFEDPLYFTQYAFHKQKLVFHRASMKEYAENLSAKRFTVHYVSCAEIPGLEELFEAFSKKGITRIHYCDTTDYLLERRMKRHAGRFNIRLVRSSSPAFFLREGEFTELAGKGPKYLMASFYARQRKKLKIMVGDTGEPAGGKWSFDEENRKRLPRGIVVPKPFIAEQNRHVREAIRYVETNFAFNPGSLENFTYATNHGNAAKALDDFIAHRLREFGPYEDAISGSGTVLFHSVLSPYLNAGFLTPHEAIERVMQAHAEQRFPLNSLEGFVRQIIGWREFMRGVYEEEGVVLRTRNLLGAEKRLPDSFYLGTTGIDPVDVTIRNVTRRAYCHHIERLMILGNFMHLCGFDPNDVYRWFMELFIDAYDWVMVPNVYGMSQYAAGGMLTTKPYVSGSNYILKMSDYKRGPWARIWDALYWRYLVVNESIHSPNQRMGMMYGLLRKMDKATRVEHLRIADQFLDSL